MFDDSVAQNADRPQDIFGNEIPENAWVFSHTEFGSFRNCYRNWVLSSRNGLGMEPSTRSPKLSTGTIWHKGMEYLYSGYDPIRGLREGYEEERQRVVDTFGFVDDETDEEMRKSYELLEAMMVAYEDDRYSLDPPDDQLEVEAVEERLYLPVTQDTWLSAKLDGIVQYRGIVASLEHKTLSKSGNVDNPQMLVLDLQMGIQIYALSRLLEAQSRRPNLIGALFNLARKQAPGSRVTKPIFGRHEIRRGPSELKKIEQEIYTDVLFAKKLVEPMHHNQPTDISVDEYIVKIPHNPQPWGGYCTWGCAFREVCEAMQRSENWRWLLEANFQPKGDRA